MPSGARNKEQGRSRMCSIIHGPTVARYSASCAFATAALPAAAGHSTLSGLEIVTPSTLLPAALTPTMRGGFAEAEGSPLTDRFGADFADAALECHTASGLANFPFAVM